VPHSPLLPPREPKPAHTGAISTSSASSPQCRLISFAAFPLTASDVLHARLYCSLGGSACSRRIATPLASRATSLHIVALNAVQLLLRFLLSNPCSPGLAASLPRSHTRVHATWAYSCPDRATRASSTLRTRSAQHLSTPPTSVRHCVHARATRSAPSCSARYGRCPIPHPRRQCRAPIRLRRGFTCTVNSHAPPTSALEPAAPVPASTSICSGSGPPTPVGPAPARSRASAVRQSSRRARVPRSVRALKSSPLASAGACLRRSRSPCPCAAPEPPLLLGHAPTPVCHPGARPSRRISPASGPHRPSRITSARPAPAASAPALRAWA
jgi:hypothetical protein